MRVVLVWWCSGCCGGGNGCDCGGGDCGDCGGGFGGVVVVAVVVTAFVMVAVFVVL